MSTMVGINGQDLRSGLGPNVGPPDRRYFISDLHDSIPLGQLRIIMTSLALRMVCEEKNHAFLSQTTIKLC